MATTAYTSRTDDPELLAYTRQTPLEAPTPQALAYKTLVARWSGVNFTRPVPLVDRRDLEPGDVVYSARGRALRVERVRTSPRPDGAHRLDGTVHLNPTVHLVLEGGRTEAGEGTMPLLHDAATGHTFGAVAL